MTAFLADAAPALATIAVIAALAAAGWIGVRCERVESRIPYDDGRGRR